MPVLIRRVLFLLWLAPCLCAAQAVPLTDQERDELELFRARVPELQRQLHELQSGIQASPAVGWAREKYLIAYFNSEAALFETKARVFAWQIFAANTILMLVSVLSISGVAFAGYQLWQSARHPKSVPASVDMEISMQKFRLQTGVVGIAVLAFSGIFLVLFLKEVYKIELVPPALAPQMTQRTDH